MNKLKPLFASLEQQHGLEPGLLEAVARTESAGNPNAVSPAGATGLFQFMPATAREYGIDPRNPEQSAKAAAKKLAGLKRRYGNTQQALQAYNWGEGNMASGKQMPRETREYAPKVLKHLQPQIDPKTVQWDAPEIDPNSIAWDDDAKPADDAGWLETQAAAAGAKMVSNADAIKQGLDRAATWIEERMPYGAEISKFTGGKTAAEISAETDARIAERNTRDAPLLEKGRAGAFVGDLASVLPTALIPGANTLMGATAIGAGTGAAITQGGLEERARGALAGGLGGLGGVALGRGIGQIANRTHQVNPVASQAVRDGFVIPPSDVRSTLTNELVGGLSGKIKTAQVASARNQGLTNRMVADDLGLQGPITTDALNAARKAAGSAYQRVAATGTIQADDAFVRGLDAATADMRRVATQIPGLADDGVIKAVDALKVQSMDADTAIAATRVLRDKADAAYRAGDKSLGRVYRSASDEVENLIERHLQSGGQPASVLKDFRAARQKIAKTYSAEKALNPVTGDINAQALARQLQKGKLSGGMKRVAEVATAYPKAMQSLKEAPKAWSPLDFAGGGLSAGLGSPAIAAGIAARPALRWGLLSAPAQRAMLGPGLLEQSARLPSNELLMRLYPGLLGLSAAEGVQP